MDLKIEKMQIEDFKQIQDRLQENFDDFWTKGMLKEEIENKNGLDSYYTVAKENEEVVGFVGSVKIIDEMEIMNIVVRKDKRNLKIGSELLKETLKIATKLKCKSIILEVNKNNIPAIRLYDKYGFKAVGVRKKYYNNIDDAILMKLSI